MWRARTAGPNAETTLTLVAFAVPEPGWSKVAPAFAATEEGKGVAVTGSYGASGDQSRGRRVRQARRPGELLGRARHHPARQGRQSRRGLECGRHQGDSLRFGGQLRGPRGQPQEHPRLERPAAARRRGHHAQPAELGVGQVEPARALRMGQQRWPEPPGRHRFRHQAGDRARQTASRFGSRGHRRVQAGQRRCAAGLRERGTQLRSRVREPAADLQDRESGRRW